MVLEFLKGLCAGFAISVKFNMIMVQAILKIPSWLAWILSVLVVMPLNILGFIGMFIVAHIQTGSAKKGFKKIYNEVEEVLEKIEGGK